MKRLVYLILAAALWAPAGFAASVDLATVPPRQSVQLTIYNSEDITLVSERRTLSFKAGLNPLQFSWANTLIDPTSVEVRFPGNVDRLEVIDTAFPHHRPQQLVWNVRADEAVQAEIEISYFTSGISWAADYQAIAAEDETALDLSSFVRVDNRSGEDYDNARVRLVVGTINLVQRISELAQRSPADLDGFRNDHDKRLRRQAVQLEMRAAEGLMADQAAPAAPKQVQKQSLSDYFIYTVDGTETIPDGWSKRLRSFAAERVPIGVEYRYRPREYGDQLTRFYLLDNDAEAGLGTTPLPDGKLNVFRRNPAGGLSFVAARQIRYVPIGEQIELNLGADPQVGFEQRLLDHRRDNFWLRLGNSTDYRRLGSNAVRSERRARVAGWDEHDLFGQRIVNFSGRPIRVEVRRSYDGDVLFTSPFAAEQFDYRSVVYRLQLEPGERVERRYRVTTRQGYNSKQNRVEIARGELDRDR